MRVGRKVRSGAVARRYRRSPDEENDRVAVARRLAAGRLISLSGGSAAYIALVAAIYSATGSALIVRVR